VCRRDERLGFAMRIHNRNAGGDLCRLIRIRDYQGQLSFSTEVQKPLLKKNTPATNAAGALITSIQECT
jgi:hypothetical protein